MPEYEFSCEGCGAISNLYAPITQGPPHHPVCPYCDLTTLRRIYSFATPRPYEAHWNQAVGKYVRSDREFKDALKAASDHQSAVTGYEANYVPIAPGDIPYTPDESQLKGQRDRGETASKRTYVT